VSIDPTHFASVPFRDRNALMDFGGILQLYHQNLAEHIFRSTGATYRLYPIGTPSGEDWLLAVQRQNEAVAKALNVAGPPDLASYDLSKAEDHASFFFALASYTRALRDAAHFS
jgi:hypothetical protein